MTTDDMELNRLEERAKRKAVEIRNQGNVLDQAMSAWQRSTACLTQINREYVAKPASNPTERHERRRAALKALEEAEADYLATLYALSDDELDLHLKALTALQEAKDAADVTSIW